MKNQKAFTVWEVFVFIIIGSIILAVTLAIAISPPSINKKSSNVIKIGDKLAAPTLELTGVVNKVYADGNVTLLIKGTSNHPAPTVLPKINPLLLKKVE